MPSRGRRLGAPVPVRTAQSEAVAQRRGSVAESLAAVVMLQVLQALAEFARDRCTEAGQVAATRNLRVELFASLLAQDIEWYDRADLWEVRDLLNSCNWVLTTLIETPVGALEAAARVSSALAICGGSPPGWRWPWCARCCCARCRVRPLRPRSEPVGRWGSAATCATSRFALPSAHRWRHHVAARTMLRPMKQPPMPPSVAPGRASTHGGCWPWCRCRGHDGRCCIVRTRRTRCCKARG